MAALRAKVPDLRRELENDDLFGGIYNFSFLWACEVRQLVGARLYGCTYAPSIDDD